MLEISSLVVSYNMVTIKNLAKKVEDWEEKNRLLRERLEQLADKLDQVEKIVEKKEGRQGTNKDEEEVPREGLNKLEDQKCFLKYLDNLGGKTMELPIFDGKINIETVIDGIEALENYFECEGITEEQKVKLENSKMKGEEVTWWKFIQEERANDDKKRTMSWKIMVLMVKEMYLPEDYEVQLHQKRHNLRQREMDINAYTEELQKLSLRSRITELECVNIPRYLNGLRKNIQEELQLLSPNTISRCYQLALKVEEKFRRQDKNNRGRGTQPFRGTI